MDQASVWLAAAPRGWLILGLATLTPALVRGASPSQVALALGGLLIGYRALQRLALGLTGVVSAGMAANAVRSLLQAATVSEPPPAPAMVVGNRLSTDKSESIVAQARDLMFRYRHSAQAILHGCSIRIAKGARLLLEGPSGSGKTTFASILAGLHKPDAGLLLMDGLDRSVLGGTGWRTRVVMAPQSHDNYLVAGTLAFNLLMGRRWPPEPSDLAEAEAVCQELGLGDLLRRLPCGLQQMVGETGWQLSQGERVRVFLARALLQRPDLLVLDESFSGLDADNVDRAIRCVSHRASTVLAIAHV